VIVVDFNIERSTFDESKANTPLIIDPNAPLTFQITPELLKPIIRGDSKLLDTNNTIEDRQLAKRDEPDVAPTRDSMTQEEPVRIPTTKRFDSNPARHYRTP